MKTKDFKEFLNLKLVDVAEGIIGESISFIFEVEKDGHKFLKGFRIYPKNIKSVVIETYNEVKQDEPYNMLNLQRRN